MILYPIFATSVGFDHVQAGIFIGGTIHDVAQVVGAGYMISPETGDIATYVKLLRVAMLLPAVFAIAFVLSRTGGAAAGAAPEASGLSARLRAAGRRQLLGVVPHSSNDFAPTMFRAGAWSPRSPRSA